MEKYHFKIKGKSGKNSLYCYFSAKSEARADREIMNLLEDNHIETGRGKDYALPARIECPDGELPEEGVFCEITENGELRPLEATTNSDTPDAPDTDTSIDTDSSNADTITDSDNTAVDPLPAYAYNVNGELMSDVEKDMTQSVSGKSFAVRFRANWQQPQCVTDVATWRLQEINAELMDPTGYMADIELALSDKEISSRLDKLEMRDVHCYSRDIEKVFPENKRPGIQHVREFTKAWLDTDYIDRGLLVKEWQKGNRVSCINRTPSGANAGGGIQSDRKMPQTILGLEFEIALGLLARKYEFDVYSLPLEIELKANTIMNAVDDPEWLATRELFVSMPGGLDYSRACIIATVKTTPENLYESPFRHREYLNKVLTETDHTNPDPLVVDIACGRSSMPMPMKVSSDDDEEKSKQAGVLADEPATAETVEPDTTEHHPNPQPLDAQSSVESDKTSREQFSEQLAADRGDFVPGISDPDDPKWVRDDYSASNEGEKTEVAADDATDTADYVDHSEEFSSQPEPETSHSEPVADQNEPETPETEPEPQSHVPDDIQPGIYFGVTNEAYHAGPGVSKSQLDDIAVCPAFYQWRKSAPVDTEKTKALDMGTALHCRLLEPDEFKKRFIIAPEFNRRTTAGKEEEKAFLESCENSGKTVMTSEEGRKLELMYGSVMAHPGCRALLEAEGKTESSIYWTDTETGELCRIRPDKFLTNSPLILDVKKVADMSRFARHVEEFRYHVQAAMYCEGWKAYSGETPRFAFLAVSESIDCGKYPVHLYILEDEHHDIGYSLFRRDLNTYHKCKSSNKWGWGFEIIERPYWARG